MKKNVLYALLCAATIAGISACSKTEQEFEPDNGQVHSVTFKVQLADDGVDTKTALMFKMVPDWRNTDVNDIHIFETETTPGGSYFMEASKVEMTTPVEGTYEKALFYTEFDNATVIVTPPETKAGGSTFSYTGILGQRVGDTYTLPAVQYPHAESNIDPKADFLVGRVKVERTETLHEQTFDINFHRPVALTRMLITNLEGSKVLSVKLTSLDDLTGSLKYEDIDFSIDDVAHIAEAVDFKHNDNSNVLTLLYPGGRTRTSIFQPFFVTLAGAKRITAVEVRTDRYIYTKTYGTSGATINFSASQMNDIVMDMTVKEGGNVTRTENNSQDIKYMLDDVQVTEENGIVYDLFEHEGSVSDFVAPTLTGAVGTVTYSSSKTSVASVSDEGVVTLSGEVGEAVISAFATGDSQYAEGSASYKITVKDSSPKEQELVFTPASLTVTLGEEFTEPTLSGAMTDVTYTSGDEGVALVNAESGKLTLVAAGITSITATAAADEVDGSNYMECSLSYELTVVAPATTDVVKVEPATELVAGEKYVLISNGFALVRDGATASAAAFDATAMTVAVPVELQGNLEWTMGQNADSNNRGNFYDFKNGDYYFGIAMNTSQNPYTYSVKLSTSKSNTGTANETFPNHNVNLETGYVYYRGNSSSQYVYYDTASNAWKNHQENNGTFVAAYGTKLYKLKDERAEQTAQFSDATAEYDLYTSSWTAPVPTLQNAQGAVTYESDNTAVATVDASGAVTIAGTAKKGDTAVITARVAGNGSYKPGTASYTIYIVNTDTSVPVFTKVTSSSELVEGGTYAILYQSGDVNKAFKFVLNSGKTAFSAGADNAVDVVVSGNEISADKLEGCQFRLAAQDGTSLKFAMLVPKADGTNDYYFRVRGASANFEANASDSGYRSTFAITSSGELTIVRSSGSSNYNFRYSSSNGYFQTSTSNTSSNLYLYKLGEGGTTPDPTPDPPTPSTYTYSRISGDTELVTGTYLIVEKTDTYLFNATGSNNGGYSTIASTSGITQSGTTITLTDEIASGYEFVFTRTGENVTIKQVGGSHANQYMFASSAVSNSYIGFQAAENNFTINQQAGDLVYVRTTKGSSTAEYLYKKSGDTYFKLGGSGDPGGVDAGIYLYKKN